MTKWRRGAPAYVHLMLIGLAAAVVGCGSASSPPAATVVSSAPAPAAPAPATTAAPAQPRRQTPAASPHNATTHHHTSTPPRRAAPAANDTTATHGDRSIVEYGRQAPQPDQAAIASVIQAYNRAVAARDGVAVCRALASTIRAQITKAVAATAHGPSKDCAHLVPALFAGQPAPLRAALRHTTITGVRLKGDRGFAFFRQPGMGSGFFPVVRENGAWKPAALGGSITT